MFFVLSTGRCGSTTIADYLSQSTNTTCVHEPYPQYIIEAPLYLYGEYDHDELVRSLRATRQETMDGKQYGESNHNLSYMVPALKEAFPNAKFIWLIRNAADCVASMSSRGWYTGSPGLHEWEKWRISGSKVGALSTLKWHRMSAFARCCWHWSYKNELIENCLENSGAPWLQIRLEDITAKGEEISNFLNINFIPEARAAIKNKALKSHTLVKPLEWSRKQKRSYNLFCESNMKKWYPDID